MLTRSLPYAFAVAVLALGAFFPSRAAPAPWDAQQVATARVEAAKAAFEAIKASFAAGKDPCEAVYTWSVRWLAAQLDAGAKASAALQDHLTRMKNLEGAVTAKFQSGAAPKTDALATAYYRAEAELWVARKTMR